MLLPFRVGLMQVLPQVYQIRLRQANIFLLEDGELTLVDTGYPGSAPFILDFVRYLGHSPEKITLILITHNHWDHVGSLAELKALTPARVAIHRADIAAPPYPFPLSSMLRLSLLSPMRKFMLAQPSLFDLFLEGGEEFPALGGLQVIPTPGHTPGSISLYAPQSKLLLVGDALTHRRGRISLPMRLASLDGSQARESAKRLAGLEVDALGLGHGRPIPRGAGRMLRELAGTAELG